MVAHDASIDGAGRNDKAHASSTTSSWCISANITGETVVWPPRWFAKNVRQVVTGSSAGRADNARRCVPTRRCRASVIRRGSAERPRDNSQRLYAESDRDRVIRCVVFRDVAGSGASIDVRLRDANDREWLAGSASVLPATGATTTAKTAKTDGQLGESVSSNERGRRVGGAAQESRARGLDASPEPIGPQHPS